MFYLKPVFDKLVKVLNVININNSVKAESTEVHK